MISREHPPLVYLDADPVSLDPDDPVWVDLVREFLGHGPGEN